MDVSGNVSADFVPQYDLRVHFETLWIWASKIIFLEYAVLILFPNMIYAFILKRFGYGHRKLFFWNMLIPFLVIFDYLLLLPSTMYGVSGLRSLSKTGKASKAGIMINGICQFLLVFDVISAAYLYIRFRNY